MRAAIFTRGGAVVCVATTDRAAGFPTGGELVEERDASGALIPMQRRDLMLEGAPPGRFIAAAELRRALELDGNGRPRVRADAPAELRALRLVDLVPELPAGPELAGGAASLAALSDGYLDPTPPGWRDRLGAWWRGTTVALLLLLCSAPLAAQQFPEQNAPALKSALRAALAELLARPAFHTGAGDPAASLGFAGDAYLDLTTGAIWTADEAGAWIRRGELWLDLPPGPPALPGDPPSL